MLSALSIRDIVLIERLDLSFDAGMTVLTGETGAGKSILLDALGLALGARGDAALVRAGAERGVVTAEFDLEPAHKAFTLLAEADVASEGELVVRRVQSADGRSRATINDQPASVGLLRRLGGCLAEIHGQHDDRALLDPVMHRDLVDAFGELEDRRRTVADLWQVWKADETALNEHAERLERAEEERAWLEHAVQELQALSPQHGEEEQLTTRRQLMMNSERFAEALDDVDKAISGDHTQEASLNAGLRKLERRQADASGQLDGLISALDRLVIEMNAAKVALDAARATFVFDAHEQSEIEERLFALRDMARKHRCQVEQLPDVAERLITDLANLKDGQGHLDELRRKAEASRAAYFADAEDLSVARRAAASDLDDQVMQELAPLKLEKATFVSDIESGDSIAGVHGIDRLEFKVATNPGAAPGAIIKVASGGELSRFMLALKVVLAARGSAPTLVFDEIDTGIGGATADAMGQRLARLSGTLQVLAVTHSPQVAVRADSHMLITKMEEVIEDAEADARLVTRVTRLQAESRREEVARMLSGANVTDEARAQADRLMRDTG
ncbi:MAG: DNA repair protein RecN [Rhizobiales bacterium]|nr:DNA repair protein RecN [Hyphomicrobiales bacterium]